MTETNKDYNGWTNYETWVTALWIEDGSYNYRCELCEAAKNQSDNPTSHLAETIKDWIEGLNPLADKAGLFSDLINAALNEVNWHEIAENFLSK